MAEGMLDTVLMILVLAIVVGLAFSLILPLINSDMMGFNEQLQDKGVVLDKRSGEVMGTSLEPEPITYDARGVVLTVHVQDENMPKPKAIQVGSNPKIVVESVYKLNVIEYGLQVWGQLIDKTAEYDITYDFEEGSYVVNPVN